MKRHPNKKEYNEVTITFVTFGNVKYHGFPNSNKTNVQQNIVGKNSIMMKKQFSDVATKMTHIIWHHCWSYMICFQYSKTQLFVNNITNFFSLDQGHNSYFWAQVCTYVGIEENKMFLKEKVLRKIQNLILYNYPCAKSISNESHLTVVQLLYIFCTYWFLKHIQRSQQELQSL